MRWKPFTPATKPSAASRFWRARCSSASRRCWWSRRRLVYAERHDNIEAIYKKLTERRDTADVTELLKELHRIVNEAIAAARRRGRPGQRADGRPVQIDLEKLRDEFAKKVQAQGHGD